MHILMGVQSGCYFLDRDGRHFHDILNFLRVRFLHAHHSGHLLYPHCILLLQLLTMHIDFKELSSFPLQATPMSLMYHVCRMAHSHILRMEQTSSTF